LIDWSYDLLDAQECALLCRLSIFVGGWTLEAAEQICSTKGREQVPLLFPDVLDLLTSLHDKSLVRIEERYGELCAPAESLPYASCGGS